MADTKISALTAATTPLAGTEVLPIVQSGVTKQVSVADLTAGRAVSALSLSLTNALTAANGGTGQSSYTIGDLLYASGATALSKLADVATGNALISGGVGVAPSWGKIGLTTHVSGTLGVTNGGTGLSSATTGDLLYASGTNTWASLADVATGNALISGGVGVAPSWGKIGLATHVSGTLGTANGGTGLTSFTANGVVYASSTSALATGSVLTFDGTKLSTSTFAAGNSTASSFVSRLTNVSSEFQLYASNGVSTNNSGDVKARIGLYYADTYANSNGVIEFTRGGGGTDGQINFVAGGAVRAEVQYGGDIKFNTGNLIQGTAAKGINFTANSAAAGKTSQLLNWYEEGTWTPVLTDNTHNATMDSVTGGTYTRIGNRVILAGYVTTTSIGSVTGNLYIKGFPFAVANLGTYDVYAGCVASGASGLNITAGQSVGVQPMAGTTTAILKLWDSTTGTSNMQATSWTNTGNIVFVLTYRV